MNKIEYKSIYMQYFDCISKLLLLSQTAVEKTFKVGPQEINWLDSIFLSILDGAKEAAQDTEKYNKKFILN